MGSLAVFAHFDPSGQASSYVLRHLEALGRCCDHVIVVTTTALTGPARAALSRRGQLVERPNTGYDFYSWKVGLEHHPDWPGASRLILANDSVVGPLVDYPALLSVVQPRGPFWGITASTEGGAHLQSYLLGFGPAALRSAALQDFFASMEPLTDRDRVIAAYEHGLSRRLAEAGMAGVPYFTPSARDDRVARRRRARHVAGTLRRAQRESPAGEEPTSAIARRTVARERARECTGPQAPYNPMIALWDRALNRRIPFVKLETLRDDPYHLDPRSRMLRRLERAFPAQLEGVRAHLERTAPAYERLGRGRDNLGANDSSTPRGSAGG